MNENLREMFYSISDGVIVTDNNFNIIFINSKIEKITGYNENILIDKDIKFLFSEDISFSLNSNKTFKTKIRNITNKEISIEVSPGMLESAQIKQPLLLIKELPGKNESFEKLQQNAEKLEALALISKAITEIGWEYNQIIDLITMYMSSLLGDLCIIRLLKDEKLQLESVWYRDEKIRKNIIESSMNKNIKSNEGLSGIIINTRESVFLPDIDNEAFKTLIRKEFCFYSGCEIIHSLIAVPMIAKERIIGTLLIVRDITEKKYEYEDVIILQDIADRTAMTITSAEIYNDNLNKTYELMEVNAELEKRVVERTAELNETNKKLETVLENLFVIQTELVRSEKLASLGSTVAGIAHELNTPIGNSVTLSSTIYDITEEFKKKFYSGSLKRSELENFINSISEASSLLLKNNSKARELVVNFKQIVADQTSEQKRKFNLKELIEDIINTLFPSIHKTNYNIYIDIPENIEMESYPGPLGQVFTNLINNSITHGFEGKDRGSILIQASIDKRDEILIDVVDDGIGIEKEIIPKIFDPFFSTKLGCGGNGLGLNIVYNIVNNLLKGTITVESKIKEGTTFTLTIPKIPN